MTEFVGRFVAKSPPNGHPFGVYVVNLICVLLLYMQRASAQLEWLLDTAGVVAVVGIAILA